MELEVGKQYISRLHRDIVRISSVSPSLVYYDILIPGNQDRRIAIQALMKMKKRNGMDGPFMEPRERFIEEYEEFMPEKEENPKIIGFKGENFKIEIGKVYINNFNGNKIEVVKIEGEEIYYKIIKFKSKKKKESHKILESILGKRVYLNLKEKEFRKNYIPFIPDKKVESATVTVKVKPDKKLIAMLNNLTTDKKTFIIRKRLRDCSIAHRLMDYNGKCENLHGHTYHFEICLEVKGQEKNGISVDFNDFKEIDKFLQDNWDHTAIINIEDTSLKEFLEREKQRLFTLYDNPTAENMCLFLKEYVRNTFKDNKNIVDIKVKIWETETSVCEL